MFIPLPKAAGRFRVVQIIHIFFFYKELQRFSPFSHPGWLEYILHFAKCKTHFSYFR